MLYTKKVIDHFKNPHNFGKMKNPDGVGRVGNIVCGDVMQLYIKVGKNKKKEEVIKKIKFETFGCVAALATSSVITDLAKGKTLERALSIEKTEIIRALGGLPKIKIHCSILASEALAEAVYDYLLKNNREIPKTLQVKHKRNHQGLEKIEKKWQKI
jgi:nitrogen fixation NifU-like protein